MQRDYRIGLRKGRLADETRPDWRGEGPRPISWLAWYPADEAAEQRAVAPRVSWFRAGPAAPDAALSPAQRLYPVVLLSHGTGGTAWGLEWLGRRLAAQGFVAIAVNHHGNSAMQPYRAEGFIALWERAPDLTILLDALLAGEGPLAQACFAGRLDPARCYAAGFSAGAHTVLQLAGAVTRFSHYQPSDAPGAERWFSPGPREFPDLAAHLPGLLETSAIFRASWARMSASYRDNRIRAILACAPGRSVLGFAEESLAAIETPIRIITGDRDEIGPPDLCASWLAARLPHADLEILEGGVGHYVFLPEATDSGRRAAPEICVDAPRIDRAAIHAHVAAEAVKLFNGIARQDRASGLIAGDLPKIRR